METPKAKPITRLGLYLIMPQIGGAAADWQIGRWVRWRNLPSDVKCLWCSRVSSQREVARRRRWLTLLCNNQVRVCGCVWSLKQVGRDPPAPCLANTGPICDAWHFTQGFHPQRTCGKDARGIQRRANRDKLWFITLAGLGKSKSDTGVVSISPTLFLFLFLHAPASQPASHPSSHPSPPPSIQTASQFQPASQPASQPCNSTRSGVDCGFF